MRMEGYIFHCSTYVQHSPATHVVNCSNDIGDIIVLLLKEEKKTSQSDRNIYIIHPASARCGNSKPRLMKLFRRTHIYI